MNFISGTHTLILYLYILSNKDAATEAFFKNLMSFRVFWQMFKTIELISGISGLTWIMSLQRRRRSDDSSKRRQLRFGFEKIGNEATTPTSSRKGRVFRTAHRTVLFSSTHWSTTVVSVPVNYQLSEVKKGEVTKWFHVISEFRLFCSKLRQSVWKKVKFQRVQPDCYTKPHPGHNQPR